MKFLHRAAASHSVPRNNEFNEMEKQTIILYTKYWKHFSVCAFNMGADGLIDVPTKTMRY